MAAADQSIDTQDNEYANAGGITDNDPVPVTKDEEVEEAEEPVDDSDAQLQKDDEEAIDKNNILEERTRGAPASGTFREPGDEEGIPAAEDGTSSTA